MLYCATQNTAWQPKNRMKLRIFILMIWAFPAFSLVCHPKINPKLPQYLIGYGSLIDDYSKKTTDPTAEESIPVVIEGYKRTWAVHSTYPRFNTTFLAVFKEDGASFNGVIYRLKYPEHVTRYDDREIIYCRVLVSDKNIRTYGKALPKDKEVWMYQPFNKPTQYPTHECPIVQSYVDVFLRVCLHIEKTHHIQSFAKQCISTTSKWSKHWVNDRIFPRRPFIHEPNATQIDALLQDTLPDLFQYIHIE